MRSILFILMALYPGLSIAQEKPVKAIVIATEESILTPRRIECDELATALSGSLDTFAITDKNKITELLKILNNTQEHKELKADTRCMIRLHYKNGRIDEICFGEQRILNANGVTQKFNDEEIYHWIAQLFKKKGNDII